MSDETMQENAAYGEFLLQTIADLYGVEPDARRIDRAVYKGTDCGAWVRFDEEGIVVGTIIEGSDAEFDTRIDLTNIGSDEKGAELLIERFRAAVAAAEAFSEEAT